MKISFCKERFARSNSNSSSSIGAILGDICKKKSTPTYVRTYGTHSLVKRKDHLSDTI